MKDEHFALKRNEYVVEQLREFERALERRCRKSRKRKKPKWMRRRLDIAHLIVLEFLSSDDTRFCRYQLREYARKVLNAKPKGFSKAWRYVTEQVQNFIDLDTLGASP